MKRIIPILLLLLLLAGCRGLYPDEYISVEEHEAPFAYKETTLASTEAPPETEPPLPVASRASDIREAIQNMVSEGHEQGEILAVNYEGDLEQDMKNMLSSMRENFPKYVYAMHPDSFEFSLHRTPAGVVVTVAMKLRLTAQEVQAIDTKRFPDPAMDSVYHALDQHLSSYTVQVSGYTDTDLAAELDKYILHNPDKVAEAPGISVAVYPPDRGSVRVLEFHFDYDNNKPEVLQTQQADTADILEVALKRLSAVETAQEVVNTLYNQLVPAFGYEDRPETTVYSLVVKQQGGSSRIMASVAEYLCLKAHWDCEIVVGEYEGKPWYWNRLLTDGQWLYFDLHTAGLNSEPPVLKPAAEMTDYEWDAEVYREIEPPQPPTEPPEPTGPTEPTAPTEPVSTTEPPEPSAPTEPTMPTEPTEEPTEPAETVPTEPTTEPTEPSTEAL